MLSHAQALPEKDPYWWTVATTVALGQAWEPAAFVDLLEESHTHEPKFWNPDLQRAYSLLPRWYGQKGDWEKFAMETSLRPDGLGAEIYARIVIHLQHFYDNIFRDTKASWERTREGLELMRQRYPDSPEAVNYTALLATGQDRELAQKMFAEMGDRYVPSIWSNKPERLTHYRHWAFSGKW